LAEALTESFCERCGTRYEFQAPTRLSALRRTRGFIGGIKNYLTSQDALSDSLDDALRSEEDVLAAAQLDAFHDSFSFCLECRQYTCVNCWNDAAGKCQSCVPLATVAESLLADATSTVIPETGGAADIWPTVDLTVPGEAESPPAGDTPMLVTAESFGVAAPVDDVTSEPEPEPAFQPLRVVAWEDDAAVELRPATEPVAQPTTPGEPMPATEPEPMPEPVAAEPQPEPMAEPVAAEPEPEPMVAAAPDADDTTLPVAEPAPAIEIAAEDEPEPEAAEPVSEPAAAATEAAPEPRPETDVEQPTEPAPPRPIAPIRPVTETVLQFPVRQPAKPAQEPGAPEPAEPAAAAARPSAAPEAAEPVAAAAESPEVAARRAQLDLLGLGDPGEGPVAPAPSNVLPYRSRGASVHPAEIAARASFWVASAREVAGAQSAVGVQSCGQCGLSLSASARFCRRCGTRQARSA
jgi:hypothetical protein